MKKYTASYANIKDNFVIINLDESHKCTNPHYGLFCVVQNIIQRGKPSIPSQYLRNELGEIVQNRALFLVSNDAPNWNVIKGDDANLDFPAERFYYELMPKYLGDLAIARNLIIPEADFKEVLGKSTPLDGQQVDFFLPQLKLVIEVDGSSHRRFVQGQKDKLRDDAIRKAGITSLRISTDDIRTESDHFAATMAQLKKAIEDADIVNNLFTPKQYDLIRTDIEYDAIIRIQILLLELLKSGGLRLDEKMWTFDLVSADVNGLDDLFRIAYEDLKLWISTIAQMLKIDVEYPEMSFGHTEKGKEIRIDFCMFQRYTDEEEHNSSCIFIRNDYFPGRDYYCIATADTLPYSFSPETEEADDESLKYVLNNLFPDLEEYRDGQPQIIKNVLMRNDTIGILPTGTGKSLCYQLAAMLQPGVSIIIVPIISLMIDQKESMEKRQIIHVNSISSASTGGEKDEIISGFRGGKYQFLWISPERFQNASFRETLGDINRKMNFAFAIIDEVHCLSEWGHDFRVSYLALIRILREYCPEATLLGLTATASQAVLEDLKAEFEVDGDAVKALTNMDRPELIFHRMKTASDAEKIGMICSIIKNNHRTYQNQNGDRHGAIGLLFCPTVNGRGTGCNAMLKSIDMRKQADEELQIRLATYHGKLSNQDRIAVQNRFMRNEYDLLLCTKAFGMGIDQPNIKYTIHDSMPQSIEAFYQEAGRAGRDKDKSVESHCYILYSPESDTDKSKQLTKEIFDPSTSIARRKELSSSLRGDLSSIMWFWNSNKDTREEEYSRMRMVMASLYRGVTGLAFDDRPKADKAGNLQSIQEALYKLSLLGIVSNWTIDYMSLEEGVVNVEYAGIEEQNVRHHLLSYINKYDPEFQFDERITTYRKYYELAHDEAVKPVTRYINILLEWTNENIMNSRLQSTYNMMQWLDPSISDEEFRLRINEFFKFSEESVIYNGIIYHPLDYNNWFDLLFVRDKTTLHRSNILITVEAAKLRLAGLQRYLESYRYNTGLNYLSGILRLYTGAYQGTEGEWRFDEAFQSIRESMRSEDQMAVILETLRIADTFNLEDKERVAKVIISHFPEYAKMIFDRFRDRYSLSILLEEPARRLGDIMEGM